MWIRRLLFTLYGIGIGVIVGSLVMLWLHEVPTLDRIGAAIVLLVYTAGGWLIGREDELPVNKRILMLPLAPPMLLIGSSVLALVLIMVAAIAPLMAVCGAWREAKFRRSMRQGRFMTLQELSSRLDCGHGTLLEEAGPKGTYRVWWTKDEVMTEPRDMSPKEFFEQLMRKGSDVDRFNRECIATYLAEESGKALLTDIPARYARRGKLALAFPLANRIVLYQMMVEP